jgi:hypothetical protein
VALPLAPHPDEQQEVEEEKEEEIKNILQCIKLLFLKKK